MSNDIEIIIHDNSQIVMDALYNAIDRGISAIGENAVYNAQRYIDIEHRIDTGTMKRSISHNEGIKKNSFYTVVGTNVFYAIYQELGTSRGITPALFLTRSAKNHVDEYIKLMKDSIANA